MWRILADTGVLANNKIQLGGGTQGLSFTQGGISLRTLA